MTKQCEKIRLGLAAALFAVLLIAAAAAQNVYAEPVTLTVDGIGENGNYATITGAYNSITTTPQREEDRVTINVAPGTYTEQLYIDKPYITIKKADNAEGTVNINWYYGVNYCYANCGTDGFYDPNVNWNDDATWGLDDDDDSNNLTRYSVGQAVSTITYYDKTGKLHKNESVHSGYLGAVSGWGPTLYLSRNADHFVTEGIYYSNSFNLYVTQEELGEGGVTPQDGTNKPIRKILTASTEDTPETAVSDFVSDGTVQYDAGESVWLVRAKNSGYGERAAAMNTNNEYLTVKDCIIKSNQDTLYCGGDGPAYFKNCDIYGGTDYIFGGATAVFNQCDLYFQGYTDDNGGGVITAASTAVGREYGYLFFDCTIKNARKNTTSGSLGRPWGDPNGPQVTFYNCKIEKNFQGASCVGDEGWNDMGTKKDQARFYEYGTTYTDGTEVDLSKRVINTVAPYGTVLDEYQILSYNPRNYLQGWDPMGFGETLAAVDSELDGKTITVPAGEETMIELPMPSDSNVEFHWESASSNAVVSEDGKSIEVIRPALGEQPIETTVILYAKDRTTGYGDKKEIPVKIEATTDSVKVFDMPVTITQSTSDSNTYTVTVTKNGALIKSQTIEVSSTEAQAKIENLPASADGIGYDVSIVSSSNDFSVTSPDGGKTTVTGVTGKDFQLSVNAQKLQDERVDLNISHAASAGEKTYDLISLAKQYGASNDIDTSDQVTVEFDVAIDLNLSKDGLIDISSGTPSNSNSAVTDRFTLVKMNANWEQIDAVDNTQGFSGAANGEHQVLNITGNYKNMYPNTNRVKVTVDYKTGAVTVDGTDNGGSGKSKTPHTFSSFPKNAQKGKLNMGIFPGSTSDSYTVSNVSVTYKEIIWGEGQEPTPAPTPTELPDGKGVYKFKGNKKEVTNGNLCNNNDTLTFVDGVNPQIAKYFADEENSSIIDPDLVANYLNFVGGTDASAHHPQITLNAPAGKYVVYYLGYNHGNNMTATVDGNTYTAGAGVNLAYMGDRTEAILKVYTIGIETQSDSSTITFNSTDQWLPDLYAIVVVGTEEFKAQETYVLNYEDFTTGRRDYADTSYTINPGVSKSVAALFASASDPKKVDTRFTEHYVNFIGQAHDDNTDPEGAARAPIGTLQQGLYTMYYLGKSSSQPITATISSPFLTEEENVVASLPGGSGVDFATNDDASVLQLYTFTFYVEQDMIGAELKLVHSNASDWIPDLYGVAITKTDYANIVTINQSEFEDERNRGNNPNNAAPYNFTEEADKHPFIKNMLDGGDDTANSSLVTTYRDTIGKGNATTKSGLFLESGSYTVYYIAATDNQEEGVYATLSDADSNYINNQQMSYLGILGKRIGSDGKENLTVYAYNFTLEENLNNGSLSFNSKDVNTWLPDLCSAVIVKTPGFGTGSTDKGQYVGENSEAQGVIRFFQPYTSAKEADKYGFYFFVGDTGEIITGTLEGAADGVTEAGGFYGDINAIPKEQWGTTIYAKGFIEQSNEVFYGETFSDSVGTNSEQVTYPE